jgi:hypothetical protein
VDLGAIFPADAQPPIPECSQANERSTGQRHTPRPEPCGLPRAASRGRDPQDP